MATGVAATTALAARAVLVHSRRRDLLNPSATLQLLTHYARCTPDERAAVEALAASYASAKKTPAPLATPPLVSPPVVRRIVATIRHRPRWAAARSRDPKTGS